MNLVQVATLITRVRQDVNLEGTTARVTDAEIMDRLNRAKGEFVDAMRESGGSGYFERTTPITPTVSGQDLYPVPKDFISLLYILAYLTPTQYIRCTPFTADMLPMFNTIMGTGWVFGQPVYYRLTDSGVNGDVIQFRPIPTGQFSYQLGYQYAPPDFYLDAGNNNQPAGSIDDRNGWSDYMVAKAAMGVCRKLKFFDLMREFATEAAAQLERIKRLAPLRNLSDAEVVRDVTRTAPAGYWEEYDS